MWRMVRHKLDSLTDFARGGYNARILCEGCGHAVEARASALLIELGPRRARWPVERIEERLRCRRCGARGAAVSPCEPKI